MKRNPLKTTKAVIFFLRLGIEQFRQSPALREQTGIDLVTIEAVDTFRRKLLKQIPSCQKSK